MYCIIISGSCAVLLPCARLYPLSAAAQLVLCHPADGEPHDHAVLGNTSPRVSITARFKREVEILGARPLSMHHPGNSVLACGTFHDRACACLRVLWCVLRKEEERGGDAGMCRFYKTDSGFSACAFSNPLMFAPLGYHRVKFQKGALH